MNSLSSNFPSHFQAEKSSKAADPGSKVLKCAKHTASQPQSQHKSPGRGGTETPPRVTTSSTPVSRRSHTSDCRKLSRSHSTSTSSRPSTSTSSSSSASACHHSGPVVITQYRERGDSLVTEAENKLRSVFLPYLSFVMALDCILTNAE